MSKNITNEQIIKKFDSPFSLVHTAIKRARDTILRGDMYRSNLAVEVLEAIACEEEVSDSSSEKESY